MIESSDFVNSKSEASVIRFEVIETTSFSLKVMSEVISIEASVSDPTTAESEVKEAVKLAISAVNSNVFS